MKDFFPKSSGKEHGWALAKYSTLLTWHIFSEVGKVKEATRKATLDLTKSKKDKSDRNHGRK